MLLKQVITMSISVSLPNKHNIRSTAKVLAIIIFAVSPLLLSGCVGSSSDYSNQWIYPEDVSSVYVEMFDSLSFRRGHEYTLTDAIAKQIEASTPYKIVSDRNLADTVLSGQITSIGTGTLATDRETGRNLENEAYVYVSVSWQNLKTGELLIDSENISASSSFSNQLGQDFEYGASVAVNRAAKRIVERMQIKW